MTDYTDLGLFIRGQRRRPGRQMTQRELAKALGRSPSEVSRWEKGERGPKQSSLLEMAKIFGVPVQVLQKMAGHTPEFDWYEAIVGKGRPQEDILLTATDAEKDDLRSYLKYLRFRATVMRIKKPLQVGP